MIVLWEDKYKALLEKRAARTGHEHKEAARRQQLLKEHADRARHEEATRRQQLLDKHATHACQQKAAALRQRLCLLSESVAERERLAELAAQRNQAAA